MILIERFAQTVEVAGDEGDMLIIDWEGSQVVTRRAMLDASATLKGHLGGQHDGALRHAISLVEKPLDGGSYSVPNIKLIV